MFSGNSIMEPARSPPSVSIVRLMHYMGWLLLSSGHSSDLVIVTTLELANELVDNATAESPIGVSWSADKGHLQLMNIQLVPGFTVTCNASNIHAYLLTTASVSVLRELHFLLSRSISYKLLLSNLCSFTF